MMISRRSFLHSGAIVLGAAILDGRTLAAGMNLPPFHWDGPEDRSLTATSSFRTVIRSIGRYSGSIRVSSGSASADVFETERACRIAARIDDAEQLRLSYSNLADLGHVKIFCAGNRFIFIHKGILFDIEHVAAGDSLPSSFDAQVNRAGSDFIACAARVLM